MMTYKDFKDLCRSSDCEAREESRYMNVYQDDRLVALVDMTKENLMYVIAAQGVSEDVIDGIIDLSKTGLKDRNKGIMQKIKLPLLTENGVPQVVTKHKGEYFLSKESKGKQQAFDEAEYQHIMDEVLGKIEVINVTE